MKAALEAPAWLLSCLPAKLARRLVHASPASLDSLVKAKVDLSANPQLLIDVSVVQQSDARTGIQRVVRSLLLQLLQEPPKGYVVLPVFATRKHGYCYAVPGFLEQPALADDMLLNPVCVQPGDIFLGLDLAAHLLPRHQPEVLRWKRVGVKVHVMVYDLLPLLHSEWFNPRTTRNFKRWIKWLAVYADSAICISEHVQTELQAWLGAKFGFSSAELASTAISLGADIDASAPSVGLPADAEFLLARMRNTPAVLMVGTLEPRKGHDQALAAFELLWKSRAAPMLVMAGRPGWKTDALQGTLRSHPQAGKKLFWLEDVSDEFLARLYANCRGALVASRGEGFGLPLIEAARYGKPVLARDIPVFRQIPVADLTLFSANTAEGLANAIQNWLTAAAVTPHGHVLSSFPTWQRSSIALLQVLGLNQQDPGLDVNVQAADGIGAAA